MGPREQQGGTELSTASTSRNHDHTDETTLNQKVSYAFGAIYVLVGILGFFLTTPAGQGQEERDLLLNIFEVNALHNIVHLLIGIALIGAARAGDKAARSANMVIGAVYLLLGIVGRFFDDGSADFLALNAADHFLHLFSGIALLAVSMMDKRHHNTTTTGSGTRTV